MRGLPGDPGGTHSRYIEARISDLRVGCLYLPNGNPAPGPKFDYKLRWFERLLDYASEMVTRKEPVLLAGDYNVMPTDLDVYNPARWIDDALFRPEVRTAFQLLLAKVGPMPCASFTQKRKSTPSGIILLPERVGKKRRASYRPSVAKSAPLGAPFSGGGRPRGMRLGEGQRPCAGLDRA
jgi:hypothetical protein